MISAFQSLRRTGICTEAIYPASTAKIQALKESLRHGGISFGELIPLLLTDNGGEFANVSVFANDLCGLPESNLFFATPINPAKSPAWKKTTHCSAILSQRANPSMASPKKLPHPFTAALPLPHRILLWLLLWEFSIFIRTPTKTTRTPPFRMRRNGGVVQLFTLQQGTY